MVSEWYSNEETVRLRKELQDQLESIKIGFAQGEIWGEGEFNRKVGSCIALQAVLDFIEDKKELGAL